MPEKPKNTKAKNGRKKKPPKRATKAELSERKERVRFLRVVSRWTVKEIATALGKSERQIKRDCKWIEKHNPDPQKKTSTARILEQIEASHDERIKRLWNDYNEIKSIEADNEKIEANKKKDDPDNNSPKKVNLMSVSLRLRLFKEIREAESAFVESMRKLGYGIGDGGESDDEILLSIKARYAKRNSNNNGSDNADSSKT
jgi:hypothetical protein